MKFATVATPSSTSTAYTLGKLNLPHMSHSNRPQPQGKRRHRAALATMAAVFLSALALVAAQDPKPAQEAKPAPSAAAPAAAAAKPAEYAGSTVCQGCHDDLFTAFQRNPHFVMETNKKRGWEGKACESCHGPGSTHAESADATQIINPAKQHAPETDRICLKCHANERTHINRAQSTHAKNEVSCTACHSIHKHGPNGLVPRRRADVNQQCATCHPSVWAQFQRPHKHPLPQGAMSCVDCHNPHGSTRERMVRTTLANDGSCFKCHGEKRGPFTFEHSPVRFEGCMTCHQPHGSANPRMLTRQDARFVCLECHANLPVKTPAAMGVVPPAFHDLRNPRYRNCTICHQKVHGSFVDRNLLR